LQLSIFTPRGDRIRLGIVFLCRQKSDKQDAMSEHRVDTLVVGGGPAGLAAAIVLGRNELSVMVCERTALPRDKPCGEGLMPTGAELLAALGASRYLEEAQVRHLAGIRFHSTAGYLATAKFAEGPGLGIRRTNLSAALWKAAQQCRSIEIRQRANVRPIQVTPRGVRVRIGADVVTARLVIGADGLYSGVRRWAGLEGPPQRPRRLGARQHFALEMPEPFVDIFQAHGIEAYVTPCGKQQAGIAFLWDPTVYRHVQKGPRLVASLLAAFPELQRRCTGATALNAPACSGPLHRVARRRATNGIILIGDAGGYIDACTGEGISIALAQALALEETVVPLLKRQNCVPTAASLAPYLDTCRKITRPYTIGTTLQLFLCRHPRVANRLVRALAANEDLLTHFVSANMGRTSFWPGWRASLRLVRAVVNPSP
jgi:2-polyprenyl-6-methoxyphenol hydroxylase-like FAD-dependent oxidoreductase